MLLTSLELSKSVLRLDTENGVTVLARGLLVVNVSLDSFNELVESGGVFGTDFSEGNDGGVLLVNELTETRLTLNNTVGDVHLVAKSGEEGNELKFSVRKWLAPGHRGYKILYWTKQALN